LGVGAVALAVASGVTGAFGALAIADDDDDAAPISNSLDQPSTSENDSSVANQPDEPLSLAAAAVLPSVVSITAGGGPVPGQGSGVIISADGYVLTNNHVVAEAADGGDLNVTLPDGSTASAEIVGRDPATDLAVIQIDDAGDLDLTAATLGSSADLVVGDTVLAIGSPLGLDGSVTSGIVSALNRAITLNESSSPFGGGSRGTTAVIDAVQTDTAINPGNSGGPLINADGEVVGVNTAIASLAQGTTSEGGNIGVGFAIPIDDARTTADQLIEDGEVTHAFLGVQVADAIREGSGNSAETTGAVIAGVEDGSPADEAGLQEGDIVTAVDGEAVRDATALTAVIRSHAPGDEVTLTVRRDDEDIEVTAALGTLQTDDD
jgi:putative serine protease PepD